MNSNPVESSSQTNDFKFRVWDKEENKMYAVLQLIFDGELDGEPRIVVNKQGLRIGMAWDKCILMQYVGLGDKNGKPIYTGDILKNTDDVEFEVTRSTISYDIKTINLTNLEVIQKGINVIINDIDKTIQNCVVTRNIYENSELLN